MPFGNFPFGKPALQKSILIYNYGLRERLMDNYDSSFMFFVAPSFFNVY